MAFGDLDLNLLLALDAVLQEMSVTKAAARLGLSQPALSGALAKLRRHFDDELIVRSGGENHLTPLGEVLRVRVRDVVSDVQRVLETNSAFDPATSDREFVVATTDYVEFRLLPTLNRLLADRAPHVRLRFVSESPGTVSLSRDELRAIDVLIAPVGVLAEVPHVNLFKDRWVLVVDKDNELVPDQPDLEQIRHLPWVLTHHRRTGMVRSAPFLRGLGVDPMPAIMTDDFFAVPFLVANSNRIALLQERLARWLAPVAGCRIHEVPADMPPHVEACWWHPLADGDAGHVWFRRLLVEAGSKVDLPAFRPRTDHLADPLETA